MVPQAVAFSAGAKALNGYLFLPDGPGPHPCLIDCHGSGTPPNGNDVSRPQTALAVLGWGFAYFFPHRAGYGNSPGTPLWTEVSIPRGRPGHDTQLIDRLTSESEEVEAAITYVAGRAEIDAGRIAIMGNSLGGVHALLAASRNDRLRAAIDFAGGANQWQDYPAFRALMEDAARNTLVPLFLGQAENDVDLAPTRSLPAAVASSGQPCEARIYPGWGGSKMEAHLFQQAGIAVWGEDVRRFLAAHCG